MRLVEVRLRIPLVLIISAVVVGRWDLIRNYWDRLTHVALEQNSATSPVSSDTEYFCPMDPGVVSNWPGKCGICNMDLVRRKRGEAVALPDGVVARMQISPYRVQLAGIRTSPVGYEPLRESLRRGDGPPRGKRARGAAGNLPASCLLAEALPRRHGPVPRRLPRPAGVTGDSASVTGRQSRGGKASRRASHSPIRLAKSSPA